MTPLPLIDFTTKMINAERHVNPNRSCYLHTLSSERLLGDVPSLFTLQVELTKAAIKRKVLRKVLAEFTEDSWYGVLLNEHQRDSNTHTITLQMNPEKHKILKENLDDYQHQLLMQHLKSWDQPPSKTLPIEVVDPRKLTWRARNKLKQTLRKKLYDKLSEIDSFVGDCFYLQGQLITTLQAVTDGDHVGHQHLNNEIDVLRELFQSCHRVGYGHRQGFYGTNLTDQILTDIRNTK